jgi:hypothetical protein
MPKRAVAATGADGSRAERGKVPRPVRRLERQLVKARDVEAKRANQLDAARERRLELEIELAALRAPASPGRSAARAPDGVEAIAGAALAPRAYCLKDHRMVAMVDPMPIQMRNGRAAVAGRCASCGARVTTTARLQIEA